MGGTGDVAKIDAFLAGRPEDQRAALGRLRATIAAAAPEAAEAMSYGIPAFKLHGRALVSYGAGRHHCAFYLMSTAVLEAHRAELEGFELGKGSIRFQPNAPIPEALVRTLVEARVAELAGGST